ncbi:RimH [Streptomyces sp. 769]|nr:RimH [Streptomyces sp. 769]
MLNAPALFDQDDDGLVTLLADPGADQESAARLASGLCPSRAITVHEG